VDYEHSKDTEKAKDKLDGKPLYGMKLQIEWAKAHDICKRCKMRGHKAD
jgi:hypothetical protein